MFGIEDVCRLLDLTENNGIRVWLDGGWGVDALLGFQTRNHDDIDLLVARADRERLLQLIRQDGFREVKKEYTTPDHSVWEDDRGRVVDLHFIGFDASGNILFEGETYPGRVIDGVGTIANRKVGCLNAEAQVEFHCGYPHDRNDVRDVAALCRTFGIPVPPEYRAEAEPSRAEGPASSPTGVRCRPVRPERK